MIAALALSGCGTTQKFWHDDDFGAPLKSVSFFRVASTHGWCEQWEAAGCAYLDPLDGRCTITYSDSTALAAPHWLWHELYHCSKHSHPNFAFTYDVPPPDTSNRERDS